MHFMAKKVLRRVVTAAPLLLLAACAGQASTPAQPQPSGDGPAAPAAATPARDEPMPSSPACAAGARATPASAEGPYFKAGAPERQSLAEPGISGTPLTLGGHVLNRSCQPVARVRVDVWQADGAGRYDNDGYRLRGHQLTDELGRYRFETVVPGGYGGRTAHVHVKVQAPGRTTLTTQLFFPDDPSSRGDQLFQPELAMRVRDMGGGKVAAFDFVLDVP